MTKNVLLTGGAGFIGSHAFVSLVQAGYRPVIFDNFCNSNPEVLSRLQTITHIRPECIEGDVRDPGNLKAVFESHDFEAVIHFAGLKSVGESVNKPLMYYDNNVRGTLELLVAMGEANVKTLVFSSSATVYGDPATNPIREDFSLSATNAYGRSKLMVEEILSDLIRAEPEWRIARLRYFNPVGAHESGLIGEDPRDIPNNLMPYVAQVAVGRRERVSVFGNDYPTPDGTGVRDYIHVMDLAEGHVSALDYLMRDDVADGMVTTNLGTGVGVSVLDLIGAFVKASGKTVPHEVVGRRPGDIAECWADPGLAKELFGWEASRSIDRAAEDAWRWQSGNPEGFPR